MRVGGITRRSSSPNFPNSSSISSSVVVKVIFLTRIMVLLRSLDLPANASRHTPSYRSGKKGFEEIGGV